jgi:hypothetical protein
VSSSLPQPLAAILKKLMQVRFKDLIGDTQEVVADMASFISQQPLGCTGIIYCFTRKVLPQRETNLPGRSCSRETSMSTPRPIFPKQSVDLLSTAFMK